MQRFPRPRACWPESMVPRPYREAPSSTASSPACIARTDFGFSQEFAEYRAYTPGDDLRHVDWNLFARTERTYLKRYRGETNSQLTILLDASNSMQFSSHEAPQDELRPLHRRLPRCSIWLSITSATPPDLSSLTTK